MKVLSQKQTIAWLGFSLMIVVSCFSLSAKASFETPQAAIAKLKTDHLDDLKLDLKKKNGEPLKIDQMFDDIEGAVQIGLQKNNDSSELIQEAGRVALITYTHDPMFYSAELLLPLYLKQKKAFEEALSAFSAKDKKLLLRTLKDAERMKKHGNG